MDLNPLLGSVILLGSLWSLFYYRLSKTQSFALLIVAWTITAYFHLFSWLFLTLCGLLGVLCAAFLYLTHWRIQLIKPLLLSLKKQLPTISETEQIALQAGQTWFEKSLFSGSPNWAELWQQKSSSLSNEERAFLTNQTERLCHMLDDWKIIHEYKDLPSEVWQFLKTEGFFGLVIPKEYGGHGFSALAHSTIVMKIASRSISAAVNTMVPNSLGPAELLLHYGTEAQKTHYLPKLARGTEIPCFGLTAPDAGSDAGSLSDIGVVVKGMHGGKEIIGIRLSFDKRYITLAPIATLIGVAFRLLDPDHLLGQASVIGLTLALIPAKHPGVSVGERHIPLNMAFMNGPVSGRDVFIPLDWIIGGVDMAGQGWRMLMECLSIGRSISLPALATACSKVVYQQTGAYARIRRQFNVPIAYFEGIEAVLAKIAGYAYCLEAARIFTASAVDAKLKPSIASAIAKYHMTEMAREVTEGAMDIHAGHAIQLGPKNEIATLHESIPISITVEGANILTRNLIIFGQGAIRCHPYLLEEVKVLSAASPDEKALDHVLWKHVAYSIHLFVKTFSYGLTGGLFIRSTLKNPLLKRLHKQITRMSAALAFVSDLSLILLGGSLKRRERLSARLGDVLSHLYLASAVLKYYHQEGSPESDVPFVSWCLQTNLYKMQKALQSVFHNYPNRLVGFMMKWIVFPLGYPYKKPSDQRDHELATQITQNATLRSRLLEHLSVVHPKKSLRTVMEDLLKDLTQNEKLLKKLHGELHQLKPEAQYYSFKDKLQTALSLHVLTQEEVEKLTQYETMRQEVVKVNTFSFDLDQVVS